MFHVLPNPNQTELVTSTPFQVSDEAVAWMLELDSAI